MPAPLRLGIAIAMLALGAPTARADPIRPQCWDCLDKLIMQLPADNPNEDPAYEQGLTPGSVLPALMQCSLDDSEIPTLQQVIGIFTDAAVNRGGAAYVRDHLPEVAKLSAEDRASWWTGRRRIWRPRCATSSTTIAACCCNRISTRVPAATGCCTWSNWGASRSAVQEGSR